ncbi:hypothetical protein MKL09_05490 [Methylobacterium sp. J-048]|uniref:hypothetical protein n=1 Tax=Methylobacterium sp. J-048 TaxID=2836635 RepID=UPI001FB8813F|nr:hypothetical protein [Methylobacterium sp. J-048]MCJ2055999.1 hypothetical protein [Methylobacterium sp. J-048]
MTDATPNLDFQEQVARIERNQAETRKFSREASIAPFTAGAAVAGGAAAAVVAFQKFLGA